MRERSDISVFGRDIAHVIGRCERCRAGHVLHDHIRSAWQVIAKKFRETAAVKVKNATG